MLKAKRNREARDESSRGSQPSLNLNRDGPSTQTAILNNGAE